MTITFHPDGTVTGGTIKSPGNIIQLINTSELSSFTCDSTSYEDFTDATLNITPSSASSKILLISERPYRDATKNGVIRDVAG